LRWTLRLHVDPRPIVGLDVVPRVWADLAVDVGETPVGTEIEDFA